MEFSFKIPGWLESVITESMLMVFVASFGVLIALLIIGLLFSKVAIMTNSDFVARLGSILIHAMTVTLIIGFIVLILLFFTGVSGIKLFLILCTIFTGSLIFSFVKNKSLGKFWEEELGKKDES